MTSEVYNPDGTLGLAPMDIEPIWYLKPATEPKPIASTMDVLKAQGMCCSVCKKVYNAMGIPWKLVPIDPRDTSKKHVVCSGGVCEKYVLPILRNCAKVIGAKECFKTVDVAKHVLLYSKIKSLKECKICPQNLYCDSCNRIKHELKQKYDYTYV